MPGASANGATKVAAAAREVVDEMAYTGWLRAISLPATSEGVPPLITASGEPAAATRLP